MDHTNKRKYWWAVFSFFAFFLVSPSVQATETDTIGYTVRPIMTENQIGDITTYFDLRIEPNQKQTLQVELKNDSDEDKIVKAQFANATTNVNGLIVYEAEGNDDIDSSLMNPLTEWVDLSKDGISIPAGETITLDVNLNVPEEEFDGVKLGGLIFQEIVEETEAESGEGVSVENAYSYVVALQVSENDTEVAVDFALGDVSPQLSDGARTVVANIQHPQARLTGGVSIQADIYEKNGNQVIASKSLEDVSFAPNSTMPYTIEWDQALKAGDYRIDIAMTRGDQKWDFTQDFTIQPEEEQEINESAVTEVEDDSSLPTWIIVAAIVVAIIVIALIAYIIYLKRKIK